MEQTNIVVPVTVIFEIIHCNPKHHLQAVILIKCGCFSLRWFSSRSVLLLSSLNPYAAVEWRPARRNQTSVLEAGWRRLKKGAPEPAGSMKTEESYQPSRLLLRLCPFVFAQCCVVMPTYQQRQNNTDANNKSLISDILNIGEWCKLTNVDNKNERIETIISCNYFINSNMNQKSLIIAL